MFKIGKVINQYKKINVQTKATVWYTICNILQNGISFLTIPIYVRILTTAEYGKYSVFQSWKDILMIFATMNLYCGVFTKGMVDYEEDRDRYTSCMQGLSTLVTGVIFLVYIVNYKMWNLILGIDTVSMLLLFAFFIFYPAYLFWSTRQKVQYKYIEMIVVTLALSLLIPVISLIFLFYTNLRENALIWGYLIVQILFGMIIYIYNLIKGKEVYCQQYWINALKFNIPLIPHYLSLIVLGQSDRIMIKNICGDAEAGMYSLAYQISLVMNIIISAVNNSLVPWTYENMKKEKYKKISDIGVKLCLVMGILTFIIIIIAPEIMGILGSEKYMEAKWVIPPVAVSVYAIFCYSLISNIEFYFGETKYIMMASIIGAVLNVILNAIYIPKFGYVAAGYTTLVCYVFLIIVHYIFMKKACKKYMCNHQVYDIRKMLYISGIMVVGAMIGMYLYNFVLVRYFIILVLFGILLINMKKILTLFNGIKGKE